MKFLMLILSIMTFTVKDKNTVTADGSWPYSMEASYHCTYQKGTVREGDTATLVVSGLGGITIQTADVYLRSNKSAGAGKLKAVVNGSVVSTKSGTLEEWVGTYDNENYHPVRIIASTYKEVNQVKIQLVGTTNSLYIEKYVLQYANASAKVVTLMNGDEVYDTMTESAGGIGVVLPTMEDKAPWAFVGWSKYSFYQIQNPPEILPAGPYYPQGDEALWAVYRYQVPVDECVATDLKSDVCVYANGVAGMAMSGFVESGKMYPSELNLLDENQYYYIGLDETGTQATLLHLLSNTYVGYSGTQLVCDKPSFWQVYHEGEKTGLYMEHNYKTYILWPNYQGGDVIETKLVSTDDLSQTPTVLYDVSKVPEQAVYTCYPNDGLDIAMPQEEPKRVMEGKYMFPFGPYELIIENGKKRLIF